MPSWLRAAANLEPGHPPRRRRPGLALATATAGQIEWVLAAATASRPGTGFSLEPAVVLAAAGSSLTHTARGLGGFSSGV